MPQLRRMMMLLVVGVLCCACGGNAQATEGTPKTDQNVQAEYKASQQRVREILAQLEKIQQRIFAENPELQKKRAQFQQMVRTRLVATDLISASDLERIQEIQRLYQSEETSQSEKQALNEEFRQLSSDFKLAQFKTMEDEEVQKVSQEYQEAVLEAMMARNPATQELIEEFDVLQARLQIMQSPGFAAGSGNATHAQE